MIKIKSKELFKDVHIECTKEERKLYGLKKEYPEDFYDYIVTENNEPTDPFVEIISADETHKGNYYPDYADEDDEPSQYLVSHTFAIEYDDDVTEGNHIFTLEYMYSNYIDVESHESISSKEVTESKELFFPNNYVSPLSKQKEQV